MTLLQMPTRRKPQKTDVEVVKGLQSRDRKTEDWFYESARRYFDSSFDEVFFDKDSRQEIFQRAFIKLWTEITDGRIMAENDKLVRQQQNGQYVPMTCALNTFMMAFAKTEFRELTRSTKESYFDELFDDADEADVIETSFDKEEDIDTLKDRIVDECIQQMPPRCVEILTLFYYEGKSLDEILALRKENTSKDGLKTGKNKCMNTLRDKITVQFRKFNLKI